MSEPTISKLPWSKAVRNGRQILDPDGNTVAMFRGPNAWRDAAHSLSCVNSLAGLNPDGVGDLIAALEGMLHLWRDVGGDQGNYYVEQSEAALAKVKGQSE